MNIGVALNYFRYFLQFPKYDNKASYRFITSRHKYIFENISSLQYINWREYKTVSRKAIGDVSSLFKSSIKLGLIPNGVDHNCLCAFYEYSFEQYFEKYKIDLFISGGVSGFERIGIDTARRMGIKTLCVWEGLFRPFTISIDPIGMNAESSIAGTPFSKIMIHSKSNEFGILWNKIVKQERNIDYVPRIKMLLGDRFRISNQLKNRIADRLDIERIRLPFHQLARSRISYYTFKNKYVPITNINAPYIFFALQTHTDSNIIINTQFGSINPFVDFVLSAFKRFHAKSGINLVIKEHPMDLFRKSYKRKNSDGVYWVNPATSIYDIINQVHCIGTIVINSTTGLESLIMQKPVLCLGKALYCYPELVETPDTLDLESLELSFGKLVEHKVSNILVKQFCGFIYDNIQIDGNIEYEPGKDEIDQFCAFIKGQLQKSRV